MKLVLIVLLASVVGCSKKGSGDQHHDTKHPKTPETQHLEDSMQPMHLMMNAPEGGTPCETAYNAYKAFDSAAGSMSGGGRTWGKLPDQATFVARCGKLSEKEQKCLAPRYWAHNHDECDAVDLQRLTSSDLFDKL